MREAEYRRAEARLWDAVGLTPEERTVRLRGTQTAVRVQVVGEGPPLLLIHGGPNAGSTWAPLVQHLPGYQCFIVDRPGTGLSEPYSITDLDAFARAFVGDVLSGLGVARASVVASSFGGYLALRSATQTPEHFERMVQMGCPAFVPGMRTPLFMRLLTIGPLRALLNALPPNERAARSIMRQIGHGASIDAGRFPKTFSDWYLDLQRYTDTMKNDGAMIAGAASLRGFHPRFTIPDTELVSMRIPTLLFWGEDDTFGPPEVARNLARLLPDCELRLLPASGHLPWIDDPRLAGEATLAFLGVGRPPTST